MKKNILLMAFFILSGSIAMAQNVETVLSEKTAELSVDISPNNMKLSSADYSRAVVKVLVPELADVTVLDHRNTGEGAPCLATYEAFLPEEVIQNNPGVERVDFTIVLTKHVSPNPDAGTCQVSLSEHVTATIRGFKFDHYKFLSIDKRHIDDCR